MQPVGQRSPGRRRSGKPEPNLYRAATNLAPYPYFSLEERDRRWEATRDAMDRAGVDCLIVPPSAGMPSEAGASSRYLTHVGGGGADVSAVFPLHREPAAIAPDAALWSAAQPWCTDLREAAPSHSAAMLVKLKDVAMRRRKIGVVGMALAPALFLASLRDALPRVQLVDFGPQLARLRMQKSAEEIAFLTRSMQIVDATYDELAADLRVGASERELFGTAMERLSAQGSELPIRLRWASGAHPGPTSSSVTDGGIERGWLILSELQAAWGGYRARGSRPLACGDPEAEYGDLFKLATNLWIAVIGHVRPGMPLTALYKRFATITAGATYRRAADANCRLVLKGCGLGADWPSMRGGAPVESDLELAPGCCFELTAIVESGPRWIGWGDSVIVTERGIRRMGSADQQLRVVGG